MDNTESIRRAEVAQINSSVQSDDKETERQRLTKEYGQVWDTNQLSDDFEVIGFMAPYVVVRRKSDHKKGSLQFQDRPRFYFNWKES